MSWMIGISLVAAFLWGIWLGLPRRFDQPLDDIDQRLGEGGDHKTVRRYPTFLNLLQKTTQKGSERRQRARRTKKPFQLH